MVTLRNRIPTGCAFFCTRRMPYYLAHSRDDVTKVNHNEPLTKKRIMSWASVSHNSTTVFYDTSFPSTEDDVFDVALSPPFNNAIMQRPVLIHHAHSNNVWKPFESTEKNVSHTCLIESEQKPKEESEDMQVESCDASEEEDVEEESSYESDDDNNSFIDE